jgi:hypothetical protein
MKHGKKSVCESVTNVTGPAAMRQPAQPRSALLSSHAGPLTQNQVGADRKAGALI